MFKFKLEEEVNVFGSTITKEYTGFTHHLTESNIKGNLIVIAWMDGEPEYWVVEPDGGIEQLHQFYVDLTGEIPPFSFLRETM